MNRNRTWLVLSTAAAIVYAIVTLGVLATAPDLRLRFQLTDSVPQAEGEQPCGVPVTVAGGMTFRSADNVSIHNGHLVCRVGAAEIHSSLDLIEQLLALRSAEGRRLRAGESPWGPGDYSYPPLTEDASGNRWVQIEFRDAAGVETHSGYVLVQSLPLVEIGLTLGWFSLQLAVFGIAAVAWWHRPFDRSSRLFFATCAVATVAFVGGGYWWVIAGSLWLTLPFVICSLFMPVVLLHFFLVFPRPKWPLGAPQRLGLPALYAMPTLAVLAFLFLVCRAAWLHGGRTTTENLPAIRSALDDLWTAVFAYLAVAAGYYILSVTALRYGFRDARTDSERNQLRWIWWSAVVSAFLMGYVLYLVVFHRARFAAGAGRLPMMLASTAFLLAYAVAIIRHRLMLVDQIVPRGFLYYVVSYGLTVVVSFALLGLIAIPRWLTISLTSQHAVAGAAVTLVAVILVLWLRDRAQQRIDRSFFREKYRLNEALSRIHRAASRFGEPAALAQMMLSSCRDVLGVERGAVYLRADGSDGFELSATEKLEQSPTQLDLDAALREELQRGGTLQRVTPGSGREATGVQQTLRRLRVALVHVLEVDQQLAGLVFLGEKHPPGNWSAEDLAFLNAMGQVTSVALAGARVVDQSLTHMNEELRLRLEKIAEQKRQIAMLQAELIAQQEPEPRPAMDADAVFDRGLIRGESPAIREVLDTVRKVAASDTSVLIRGESGTGKELLAGVLHRNGPRHGGPMVRVHCAALSPTLLESELFGHVKGAFTGAHRDKVGRFEAAHGGTLFLDEIGDISLETQIKLLRVLQERAFEPVGGTQTVQVDVRLITATHQDLEHLIAAGRFREDLYYRLNVISITLPPLRERRDDVFDLALYFLRRSTSGGGPRVTHIDDEALAGLKRYNWPGNIRELENVIERAVVLAETDAITVADLPAHLLNSASANPRYLIETKPSSQSEQDAPSTDRSRGSRVKAGRQPRHSMAERDRLAAALLRFDGNKAEAARWLGMPRSTYFSKLKKYGID